MWSFISNHTVGEHIRLKQADLELELGIEIILKEQGYFDIQIGCLVLVMNFGLLLVNLICAHIIRIATERNKCLIKVKIIIKRLNGYFVTVVLGNTRASWSAVI